MKLLTFCLLAGVFPSWSETRGTTFAPITLYVQFQHSAPEGVMLAIKDEVESIMEPIGLHFDWRDLAKAGHEVSAELAVISFKGRCDLTGISGKTRLEGALGWTHVSDGQILPFTDVSCDRVRDFAQGGLVAINAGERDEKFGRALGRVLAHELYHIFANTTRHGSMGVAKESYSVQDLLTDDFQFRNKETRLLQSCRPKTHVAEPATGSM